MFQCSVLDTVHLKIFFGFKIFVFNTCDQEIYNNQNRDVFDRLH